jgi:hypothetical protein
MKLGSIELGAAETRIDISDHKRERGPQSYIVPIKPLKVTWYFQSSEAATRMSGWVLGMMI